MKKYEEMIKKKIVMFITIVMMFTMLPLYAFAEDAPTTGGENTAEVSNTDGEEHPAQKNCWNADKTSYYDSDGNLLKNVVKRIDGKLYYFNNNGNVTKKVGKWIKVSDKKYWFSQKGNLVTGPKYIKTSKGKKLLYLFDEDGALIVKKKGRLFNYKGNKYYSLGNGKIKTGWVSIGKKAMYFYSTREKNKKHYVLGAMAKNTKIGYLKLPKNGILGEAYALGVKQLNKSGWSLEAAYKFSYRLRYKDRGYRQSSTEDYAIRGFKRKNGNCYVMASTFYVMAKLLGYDITRVAGKVAGRNPHSWTVIKQKGKERVYDPNFRNETGRSGWKIWYGKKGTWRYSNYYKVKDAF